jgi:hypothetical protein
MTAALWAVFGMTTGAAVLYTALGLTRPLDRTYLSFACIMAMLASFVSCEAELYNSKTSEAAIETVRHQVTAGHGLLGAVLVFVPSYTRVRVPRWLYALYGGCLVVLFATNLVIPRGIWFSAAPQLIPSTFNGEPYTAVVAPSLSALQYLHTGYVVSVYVLMFVCAAKLIRRGDRQRGGMLALALSLAVVPHVVDVVRDATGGTWPDVAEFGLVTWGLLMSIQLGIDYRASERHLHATLTTVEQRAAELTKMVEATLRVRDKLNTPLQTLELSLTSRTLDRPAELRTLVELRAAVTQLTVLGRMVEATTTEPHPLGAVP